MERGELWLCELGLFIWKLRRYYKLYQKTAAILYEKCMRVQLYEGINVLYKATTMTM